MQNPKQKKVEEYPAVESNCVTEGNYPLISRDWKDPKNERYHQLQVKTAVRHLLAIRKSQESLAEFANLNLSDMKQAISAELSKLIVGDPAYRDAAAIIFGGVEMES